MLKRSVVIVFAIAIPLANFGAWNDPYFRGNPKKGNILSYGDNGALIDAGVNSEDIKAVGGDDARIVVRRGSSDVESWNALTNAYESAKSLTPGGNALSPTNRGTVVIPPGSYNSGTNTLVLDANYVDIVAQSPEVNMSTHRNYSNTHSNLIYFGWQDVEFPLPKTRIYGSVTDGDTGVIAQSVEDVRLVGFSIELHGTAGTTNSHRAAFYCDAPLGGNKSYYEKMTFWSDNEGTQLAGKPTLHVYNLGGEWVDCVANDFAFRVKNDYVNPRGTQKVSPVMINVHAGIRSFGGDSPAGIITNAYFDRCTSPGGAFGGCTYEAMPNSADTTFVDCKALPFGRSWGLGDECAATLIRCEGGILCAGATTSSAQPGTFTGYAIDCIFGAGSLGGSAKVELGAPSGTNYYNAGKVERCVINGSYYPTRLRGATIRDSYYLQGDEVIVMYSYANVTNGVTNEVVSVDDFVPSVEPPWYYIGPVTNFAASNMFVLDDSDSVIMDSVFELSTNSTGTIVHSDASNEVVFINNSFNNSSVDADGLASNVTLSSGKGGWSYPTTPANVLLHTGTQPMTGPLQMGNNNITGLTANNASFYAGAGGALGINKNLELGTGVLYTDEAYVNIFDPLRVDGMLTANAGLTLGDNDYFYLGGGSSFILDSSATSYIGMDSDSIDFGSTFIDFGGGIPTNLTANDVAFYAGASGALGIDKNLELGTGTLYTDEAYISVLDPVLITGLITAEGGITLGSSDNITLGTGSSYIMNSAQTGGVTIDGDSVNISVLDLDLGGGVVTNTPTIEFTDGTSVSSAGVTTKTVTGDYLIGTTDPMEAYGGLIYVTASCNVTSPPAASGMHYTIKTMGAVSVTNIPSTGDTFWLDGAALDANDKITGDGESGAVIAFTYFTTDTFDTTSSTNWSDGGP